MLATFPHSAHRYNHKSLAMAKEPDYTSLWERQRVERSGTWLTETVWKPRQDCSQGSDIPSTFYPLKEATRRSFVTGHIPRFRASLAALSAEAPSDLQPVAESGLPGFAAVAIPI